MQNGSSAIAAVDRRAMIPEVTTLGVEHAAADGVEGKLQQR